jgi:hypothetical protein
LAAEIGKGRIGTHGFTNLFRRRFKGFAVVQTSQAPILARPAAKGKGLFPQC